MDEKPHEQGTGPDVSASRRGCLVLGGLFLLGAAIYVVLGVLAANSFVSSSGYNAVGTYLSLFIAAALAFGGIALIALAFFGWGPRDGDAG